MSSKTYTKADTAELIQKYSVFVLLVIMLFLNMVITPNFFSAGTLWNIITQTCVALLTGMGMTMIISTGGIDISVGAVIALAGIVSAKMLPFGLIPSVFITLVVCSISGLIAGFMIGKLRVQPMVVTLALMIGVRGVAQVINDAKIFNITGDNAAAYKWLGTHKILGILPVQIIPIIVVIAGVYFIMNQMVLGVQIQAVGDNPKSSRLAGINSAKTIMFVYIASSVLAGLAGILATAKIGAADGNSLGQLAELNAIAAVAVGGTSMSGGRVRIVGTVVGALIMQLLNITVNMNNIPYEYASIFKAVIIIFAVYIQREKTT